MESKNKNAFSTALSLLSRRAYFSFELRNKLIEKGFTPDETQEVLDRCIDSLMINDDQVYKYFIADWQNRKRKGVVALKYRLMNIGSSKSVAQDMINKYYDENKEKENIKEWIGFKRKNSHQVASTNEEKAKIHRFLQQRGFSFNTYRKELEEDE